MYKYKHIVRHSLKDKLEELAYSGCLQGAKQIGKRSPNSVETFGPSHACGRVWCSQNLSASKNVQVHRGFFCM